MSTLQTMGLAVLAIFASVPFLCVMIATADRHPVVAWACQGVFVILAGFGVTWLLACFYLAVIFGWP